VKIPLNLKNRKKKNPYPGRICIIIWMRYIRREQSSAIARREEKAGEEP
jgi:hypothetical protein